MTEAELRDRLALSLELHSKEGFITYNGHVSARVPGSDRILISPYGGGLRVTPEDVVARKWSVRVLPLGPAKFAPPSDSPSHTAIYRFRENVMAIAHIHPPLSTFFGIADTPIVPVHVSGAVFGAPIPLLDDPDLIKTDGQGERLARALGAHRAVLMRGHGAVTVGESVEAVFLASLYLEENARHQLFASLLGKPRPYTADETRRVRKATWGDDGTRLSRGRPIRFVTTRRHAGDESGWNHLLAAQGAFVVGSAELRRQLLPYWPKRMEEERKRGRVRREYVEGRSLDTALPVLTFDDRITLELGSHTVELIFVGRAHTPDNTIAYLRKERILFVNDLLFVELHPTADDRSDVVNWQRILRQLATWPVETVLPGHGAFAAGNGTKALLEMDRYFETMRIKIRAMKEAGKSLDEIKRDIRAELGEFARWPRERAIPSTAEQLHRELSTAR